MSRGRIARWMMEEVGEPYDTKVLEYGEEMKSPEYLEINPMGKVPALTHNGVVVTEAAAICAYLADAFPSANLLPTAENKASYFRWLFFAAGPIETMSTVKALNVPHDSNNERMLGYGNYDFLETTLINWLKAHEYIAGDRFTAADVYVGSQLNWGLRMGSLTHNETFSRYVEQVTSRPAHKRADEIERELGAAF